MKRTLPTTKSATYYSAECEALGCRFWSDGGDAQRAAREHARETGHVVRCETTVALTYNAASSEERP